MRESQKKLRQKNKELDQTRSLVSHLEDIIGDVRAENSTLQDQLDAANAELRRFKQVNDLLLPSNDSPSVNGLATHSIMQTHDDTTSQPSEIGDQWVNSHTSETAQNNRTEE